jgi:predicted nucleic acid-binding Zn ribbon protein
MANKKGATFKVEFRADCKTCGGKIVDNRFRTFCSAECRNKFNNKKYRAKQTEWQRNRYDKKASVPDPEHKCQCLICGKWYVQVGSHAYLRHGMTGRQYREKFELEVKRGIVPEWYRKLKGDQAIDNETYKNLEKGMKFRFKRGDKKAGRYKRSPITLKRLHSLHQTKKVVQE